MAKSMKIQKSSTADTRTSDFSKVSKEQLKAATFSHIADVRQALAHFQNRLHEAAKSHDFTKVDHIDLFHRDFVTGFKTTDWWDAHRKTERHHLMQEDGVKPDVDLVDVLEFIADCVMAGLARSGSVYKLELQNETLQKAFQNTVSKLESEIEVDGD